METVLDMPGIQAPIGYFDPVNYKVRQSLFLAVTTAGFSRTTRERPNQPYVHHPLGQSV